MLPNAEERVANGVAWLNDHAPAGWWNRIDLQRLAVDDADACVLGQVFQPEADASGMVNGYFYAERQFFADQFLTRTDWSNFVVSHGFLDYDIEADELDAIWVTELINLHDMECV